MLKSMSYRDAVKRDDYEAQAELFLQDCGVEMEIKYLRNDYYFHNDEDKRDIQVNLNQ